MISERPKGLIDMTNQYSHRDLFEHVLVPVAHADDTAKTGRRWHLITLIA